uniref:Uncharacterized protein n=1 Tax=Amphimedon queenslandica TaxID=400682 RepID=A0A1X7TGW9_AMPQE
MLNSITDQWNITSEVVCVTTYDALNITNAVFHNSCNHWPCFPHKINLAVTNSLSELADLSGLIKLKRYIEQHEAIRTTVCLLNGNDLLIDIDKLVILQETVNTLHPFEAVATEMSAERRLSASKMIPITKALMKLTTETTNDLALKLVDHMKPQLEDTADSVIVEESDPLQPQLEDTGNSVIVEEPDPLQPQLEDTGNSVIVEEPDPLCRFFNQRVAEVRST